MANSNLLMMELTPEKALKLLKEISSDSERVFFTHHASKRMIERNITNSHVFRCLSHGVIVEEPHRNIKGNWQLTVECMSAGTVVTTCVVLSHDEDGNCILIITVY